MRKIIRSGVVLVLVGFCCLLVSQYAWAQSNSDLKSSSHTGSRHIKGKVGAQEGHTTYYYSFDGYELYYKDDNGREMVDQVNVFVEMLSKKWGVQEVTLWCQLTNYREKDGRYSCKIERRKGDCQCGPCSAWVVVPGQLREGFNSKELIEKAVNLMHLRCGPRKKDN